MGRTISKKIDGLDYEFIFELRVDGGVKLTRRLEGRGNVQEVVFTKDEFTSALDSLQDDSNVLRYGWEGADGGAEPNARAFELPPHATRRDYDAALHRWKLEVAAKEAEIEAAAKREIAEKEADEAIAAELARLEAAEKAAKEVAEAEAAEKAADEAAAAAEKAKADAAAAAPAADSTPAPEASPAPDAGVVVPEGPAAGNPAAAPDPETPAGS